MVLRSARCRRHTACTPRDVPEETALAPLTLISHRWLHEQRAQHVVQGPPGELYRQLAAVQPQQAVQLLRPARLHSRRSAAGSQAIMAQGLQGQLAAAVMGAAALCTAAGEAADPAQQAQRSRDASCWHGTCAATIGYHGQSCPALHLTDVMSSPTSTGCRTL